MDPGRLLLSLLYCFMVCVNGQELLKNHDMEMTHFDNNWSCQGGCTLNSSKDHYSGWHSVMVTNRHGSYNGLSQTVNVVPGHRYNFTAYIKLLNHHANSMFTTVELVTKCSQANGHSSGIKFGHDPFVTTGQWTLIGGMHTIPAGYHNCHVVVIVIGGDINYLVDHASMKAVPDDPNWRTEANNRINQIRKSNITISLSGVSGQDGYTVELTQTKHSFAFGSAVGAKQIVDPSLTNYQNAFYDNFEWAVLENALKWMQLERKQGHVNYTTATTALHALKNHGVKTRAHNVFWATEQHVPSWLKTLSKTDLLAAMDSRVKGVVAATKGLIEHWDVNNEDIHGHWYEQATGNVNTTMDMFRDVHTVDPYAKLFLNDFGVLENAAAVPLRNQAKLFKDAGVPIYGVGIQSHLKHMNLDIPTLKGRLDTVAEAGLPIWITELSFSSTDENVKAHALKDMLTLYFSHPAIEGILFWGFWSGKIFKPEMALFEGQNVTPNAAGRAYQELFKTTWRTHATRQLHGNASFSIRGFKGTYTIIVRHQGHQIRSETFILGDDAKTVHIDVGVHIRTRHER